MNFDEFKKRTCRYCSTHLPEPFLDLGPMALANSYVKKEEAEKPEFTCPLALALCPKCKLVQTTHVVPAPLMFSNYLYVSSTTQTFRTHFADYARYVASRLVKRAGSVAVDIGSNDGLLVSCYEKEGLKAVGIEPAVNLSQDANSRGIKTLNRYFDSESVAHIQKEFGHADIISANNVFAHIDDIASVCRNVEKLLSHQGIFSIEFPYLVTMLDELLFDMIYHEHLSYIAVHPLSYVLNRFGMEIFDILKVSSHGGSLRVLIQKKGGPYVKAKIVQELLDLETQKGCLGGEIYKQFAAEVNDTKKRFTELVHQLRKQGETISGYGVPAKASTILNFYGLGKNELSFMVDDNPLKQGYLTPGTKIPILPSQHLFEHPTHIVVIFAWNFAREILGKIGHLKNKGVRFLIPLKNAKKSTVTESFELFEPVAVS